MALSDKDIVITPNRGQASDPKIEFKGASAAVGAQTITLNVYPTNSGKLSFESSAGALFSINNDSAGVVANTSLSSPIFYDLNDTGYYTNPASTSNLFGLTVANTITGSITGTAGGETLATITSRGASTSTSVTLSGGGNQFQGHFYYLPYDSAGNHYPHFNDGGNGTGVQVNWRLYTGASNSHTHVWRTDYTYFANRVESAGDMRATVFYDSENTGYYVNANGSSYLNSLILAGSQYFRPQSWIQFDSSYGLYWPNNNDAHIYANTDSSYGSINIRGSRNGWRGIHFYDGGYTPHLMFDGSGNGGIYHESGGRWASYYNYTNDSWGLGTSNTYASWNMYAPKGFIADTRIDSPVYYDSANTGYYLDANSTNTSLNVAGNANFGNASSNTGLAIYHGNGSGDYGRIRFYEAGNNNQTIHVFPTTWQGGTLASTSTGSINLTGANGVTFGNWNSVAGYIGNSGDLWVKDKIGIGVDASAKLHIQKAAPSGAQAVNSAASVVIDNTGNNFIEFRNSADNNSYQGLLFTDNNQGGYVVFGNAGGAGDMLRLGGYNSISFDVGYDNSASSVALRTQRGYIDVNANMFAYGSMQAPIFYDSNDTTYYLDPHNTGTALNIAGYAYIGKGISSGYYLTLNHDQLWAQGALHLQYSSAGNIDMNYGGGYTFSRTSLRAPIFYDYDDTAYYADPNSTTRLLNLTVVNTISGSISGNADTVDGQHASYFYPAITPNGYSTGDINGNTTHQRLWGTDSIQNLLQFRPPTTVEYSTDGSSWTSTSISADVFDGKVFGKWGGFSLNVGNNVGAWRYVRLTWQNFGYHFWSHITLTHSTNGHSFNLVFYRSSTDGNTWTETYRQNGISSWPGYTFSKYSDVSGWWDTRDVRIVFELNHNNDYPNNAIDVGHIGLMGSYSSFTRLYDWDGSRNVTFGGNITAPLLYDGNDTGYYLNPNSTSRLNIVHANYFLGEITDSGGGDSNAPYRFESDYSGWATIFAGTPGSSNGWGTFWAGNDNATYRYFDTSNPNEYVFVGAGSVRASIDLDNGQSYFGTSIRSPIFYDSNDTGYYLDPNSSSNLNAGTAVGTWNFTNGNTYSIFAYGNGDTGSVSARGLNVYSTDGNGAVMAFHRSGYYAVNMGLDSDNVMRIGGWSASAARWELDMSGNNTVAGSSRAPIFYDSNNTNYYLDPAGNSELSYTRFTVSGYPIIALNNTNSGNYGLIEWQENGAHKMWMGMGGSGQSLGEFSAYAQDGFSINHDAGGAFTISNRGSSKWIRLSTGTEGETNFHTLNIRNGDVIVNQNAITYSSMDNTPVVGSATTNRLHVNGSIQLTGDNDAIVFGRGTASFLKDEELGFGWGGGWYMTDGTYLRVRGSKILYNDYIIRSDYDMRAPIFYDQNDTGYYLDPHSNSILNTLRIAQGGNTALYIGSGDTSRTLNDGSTRTGISITGYAYPHIDLHATQSANTTHGAVFSMTGELAGGGFRRFGIGVANYNPNEMSFGWYDNDPNPHYGVGISWSNPASMWFDTGHNLFARGSMRAPIFYDYDNTDYYLDPNSTGTSLKVSGNIDIYARSAAWAEGIRIRMPNRGSWAGVRFTRDEANYNGNWAIGYTGQDSTDDLTFWGNLNGNEGFKARMDLSANFTVYGSVSSPIFYDYQDTAFYLDPNSTTSSLKIAGAIQQGNNHAHPNAEWAASGTSTGMIIFKLPGNSTNYGMVHMVFDYYEYSSPRTATIIVSGHNWNGSWYNISCNVVGYMDKTVRLGFKDGQYCVVFGQAGSTWEYITLRLRKIHNGSFYNNIMYLGGLYSVTQTTTESFTYVSGDLNELRTYGNFLASSSVRTPILYDIDDTNYYIDARSTSRLSGLRLDGVDNNASGEDAILWINKPNNNDWAMLVTGGLEYGIRLDMAASHSYAIRARANGTEYSRLGTDLFYHSASIQAPVFSDANNTAYFLDATSTTSLRTVGSWRSDSSTWDGEFAGKIQYHSSNWYLQAAGSWLFRNAAGTNVAEIDNAGAFYGTNVYTSNWFRNNNSGQGLYNTANDAHFYSAGNNYWHINPNNSIVLTGGLIFYDRYNSSQGDATGRKGYVYWNPDGFGLLDSTGNWSVNLHPTNHKRVTIGGSNALNPYNSVDGIRLMFGGGDDNAAGDYYIGTNLENYGGNYTKLDLRWHTGIRIGAQAQYGGVRIYDSEDLGTVRFSVNKGDAHTRVESGDFYAANLIDRDNTAYYVDPTSTDYSARLAGNLYFTGYPKIGIEDGGMDCYLHITDNNPTVDGVTYGGEFYFYGDKSISSSYLNFGGAVVENILRANSSLRAPTFSDSSDTNYYLAPANSTFSLRVRGPITAGSGGPLGGGRLELYGSYGSIVIRPTEGSTFASIRYGSGINFQNAAASTTYLSIDGSGNGTFLGNVTAVDFISTSDARLKTNIEPIRNAVETIKQIQGHTYTLKQDPTRTRSGVLAQELAKVLPGAVTGDEDTQYSVSYNDIIAFLVEAVKEQQQQIDELKRLLA